MKKAIFLLLVFVFVTLLTSSCVAGLRRDDNYRGYNDNYRNNLNYQYNDNQGNSHRRGKLHKNRYERNNHNDIITREGQNTLIIH
jgi:hypothetical protein